MDAFLVGQFAELLLGDYAAVSAAEDEVTRRELPFGEHTESLGPRRSHFDVTDHRRSRPREDQIRRPRKAASWSAGVRSPGHGCSSPNGRPSPRKSGVIRCRDMSSIAAATSASRSVD